MASRPCARTSHPAPSAPRRSRPSSRSPRRRSQPERRAVRARAAPVPSRGRRRAACSAPQQTWRAGTSTSKPLRASTATVAAFARAEDLGHDAAGEERHAPAPRAVRGTHERRAVRRRRARAACAPCARAAARARADARGAHRPLQAAALVGAQRAEQRARAARGCATTPRSARRSSARVDPAARAARVDLGAHALDQVAVAHARPGTRTHTRGTPGRSSSRRLTSSSSGMRSSATPRIR